MINIEKHHERIDQWIYWSLMGYAFSLCVSVALGSICMYLALILIIVREKLWQYKAIAKVSILKTIGVFLVAILVTLIFSQNMLVSLKQFTGLFTKFLPLIIAAYGIKKHSQVKDLIIAMAISLLIADFYTVYQYYTGVFAIRPKGFDTNAIYFANQLFQIALLVFLYLTMSQEKLKLPYKYFLTFFSIFSCVVLILNNTRGVWVALIICLIISSFFIRRKRIIGILGSIFVILLITYYVFPQFHNRVISIMTVSDSSSTERLLMWQSSWSMFMNYPAFGLGLGNFESFYVHQYISSFAHYGGFAHPHNNFFLFLSETGLIGFVAFSWLFIKLLGDQYKLYIISKNYLNLASFVITIGFLIAGLTDYNFGQVTITRVYWFIVGMSYVVFRDDRCLSK